MRSNLIVSLVALVTVSACTVKPSITMILQALESDYWEQMILAASQAKDQDDKVGADQFCIQALQYVDVSAVKSFYAYAEQVSMRNHEDGAVFRAKADRLRDAKAHQVQATQFGHTVLGFVPWEELMGYADLLQELQRSSEAESMRALSKAYKYSQEVQIRRTVLLRRGKDPRGVC